MFHSRLPCRSHGLRSLLVIALLLVVAGRIMAMPGWMPTVSKDRLVVTLCAETGGGQTVIEFDREHKPKTDNVKSSQCLFAGLDHAGVHDDGAVKATPHQYRLALAYDAPPIIAGIIADQAPPPPSTGPPLV